MLKPASYIRNMQGDLVMWSDASPKDRFLWVNQIALHHAKLFEEALELSKELAPAYVDYLNKDKQNEKKISS